MKALMVIDVDYGDYWDSKSIKDNSGKQKVASAIKAILEEWRAKKGLICFIIFPRLGKTAGQEAQFEDRGKILKKYPGPESIERDCIDECLVCNSHKDDKLAAFLEHQHQNPLEPAFTKTYGDAFTNKHLTPYLKSHGVTELVLIGCLTFYCVKETAEGAVKAGFNVTLLKNGVYPPFADNAEENRWVNNVKTATPFIGRYIRSIAIK